MPNVLIPEAVIHRLSRFMSGMSLSRPGSVARDLSYQLDRAMVAAAPRDERLAVWPVPSDLFMRLYYFIAGVAATLAECRRSGHGPIPSLVAACLSARETDLAQVAATLLTDLHSVRPEHAKG